jgi:tRNA threonylcarbamoyladenosine biosynthesis protein TsaB
MKVLAIETSSAEGSVAVADDGRVLEVRRFLSPRGRGTELFSLLAELRPVWTGADRLAVGLGPGSYNGLRAACALAMSFQLALGLDLVVAPSPCLLDTASDDYIALGDARGGRTFYARVRQRQLDGEIELLDAAALAERGRAATGLPFYRVGSVIGAEQLPEVHPDAAVLARLASGLTPVDPAELEPLYLKPPHITTPRAGRP